MPKPNQENTFIHQSVHDIIWQEKGSSSEDIATPNATPKLQATSHMLYTRGQKKWEGVMCCDIFVVLSTLHLVCFVFANYTSHSLGLKRKYPLPCLHRSTWTFLMTCLKQGVKISLLASLLHFSLGSAALLLVKKSSYPIMSGAMLEWSPCPYLPHITWSFSQLVCLSVYFFSFFVTDQCKRSISHHVLVSGSCICQTDSLSRCLSLSLRWV